MSIATEIERIQNAKSSIKFAIESKGVSVGNGTIDTFAEKILEITGGGTVEGLNFKRGTVEFADANNCVIEHNLGIEPKILCVWTEPSTERQDACLGIIYNNIMGQKQCTVFEDRTSYTEPKFLADYPQCIKSLNNSVANIKGRNEIYALLTGVTYNWLAIDTDTDEFNLAILPDNITAINGGIFKQETNMGTGGTLDIIHGLSTTPDIIVINSDIFDIAPAQSYYLAHMFYNKKTDSKGYSVFYNNAISTRVHSNAPSEGITVVDDNKFTIKTAGNRQLGAGVTYSWVAISLTPETEVIPRLELDRYIKVINLISLDSLGRKEVILNLDNITGLGNFAQVASAEFVNNTVEHLTLNVKNKITTMAQMLYCHSSAWDKTLKHLTLNVDTSLVTSFNLAFNNQRTLEIVDGKALDLSSATNVSNMFGYCNNLREVRFVKGSISIAVSFKNCAYLSEDSKESLVEGLADLTGGNPLILTLHKDLTLTEEQTGRVTSKNWTISYE